MMKMVKRGPAGWPSACIHPKQQRKSGAAAARRVASCAAGEGKGELWFAARRGRRKNEKKKRMVGAEESFAPNRGRRPRRVNAALRVPAGGKARSGYLMAHDALKL